MDINNKLEFDQESNMYIFKCPNCELFIIVKKDELNCQIFRHGYHKNNFTQINPHETKEQCENLLNSNSVIGCCKPFRLIYDNSNYYAISCDYI